MEYFTLPWRSGSRLYILKIMTGNHRGPLRICIISCGTDHPHFDAMHEWAVSDDLRWHILNLRELLNDPVYTESVRRGVDGNELQTQIAIFSQESFPYLIIRELEETVDGRRHFLWFIYCKSGFHRAHTSCLTLQQFGRRIDDGTGMQRFEILVLPLHSILDRQECYASFKTARRWTAVENNAPLQLREMEPSAYYGYAAARERPACQTSFRMILSWLSVHNKVAREQLAGLASSVADIGLDTRLSGLSHEDLILSADTDFEIARSHGGMHGPLAIAWRHMLAKWEVYFRTWRRFRMMAMRSGRDRWVINKILADMLRRSRGPRPKPLRCPGAYLDRALKDEDVPSA